MAVAICCNSNYVSSQFLSGGPSLSSSSSSCSSGLLSPSLPLHNSIRSRSSSSRTSRRRSGIAVMEAGGEAILNSKQNWGWGSFQCPLPISSSVVKASTNLALGVSDVDSKTDDVSTLKLPPLPEKQVLVGVGVVGLDFLASVASYPDPDAKIRTLDALAQGGGNVGNALTAAARLGLRPRIFSKVANDSAGIGICKELESNGVDASHIVVAEEGVSPFTYIIVDKEAKTRTCIHTPGHPPFEPQDLSPSAISSFLNGAGLLYLDGRLPEATLLVAEEARRRQLPIIVDAERKREKMGEILTFADYLVCSAKFPQVWTEAPTLAEALIGLAVLLPRLRFIIVTQGSQGCVMLERSTSEADDILDPNATLLLLRNEAEQVRNSEPTVFSSKVGAFQGSSSNEAVVGRLLVGTAATLQPEEVVDTTGAGDAFIGGITYGILAGFPPEQMLRLGATVAAAKCKALGARTGLPLRSDPSLIPWLQ
ncbi:unnamed protein product [Calypogeia fissa]